MAASDVSSPASSAPIPSDALIIVPVELRSQVLEFLNSRQMRPKEAD